MQKRLLAADINISAGGQFSGLESITAGGLVSAVIGVIMVVAAIILIFVILFGGIAVMTSGGGDPQKAARGKSAVTAGVIGLVIVFCAWGILNFASTFFGVNLLQMAIPNVQNP